MPQISDRQWIEARLEKNRPWAAYALADLEPGYFEHTSWFCDPHERGLTLLYRGFSRPLIFCIDRSGDSKSIIDEIECILDDSSDRYVVSKPEDIKWIRDRYRVRDERRMIRMTLDAQHFRPVPCESITRLGPDHLQSARDLYTEGPPEFFLDRMLTDGVYFGLFEGSSLISIAGTHVVSRNYGVGGLGNICTRADRRSRGHGTRVTSAVSSHLLNVGITTIVLNVREDNDAAIRVYDRLGFQPYCRYIEMVAALK